MCGGIKINGFSFSASVFNCLCEADCLQRGNVIYANVTWMCINGCSQNDSVLIESHQQSEKEKYKL